MPQVVTSLGAQLGLAVAGGLCGALLNNFITVVRDCLGRADSRKLSALQIALTLEQYASDCLDPIYDLANFVSSMQSTREPSGHVPVLAEYPTGVDWKSFGIERTSDTFNFRVSVQRAQGYLSNAWEFEGTEAAWNYAALKAAALGQKAWQLSTKLRAEFGLPLCTVHGDFDIAAFFQEELTKAETRSTIQSELD